MKIKAYCITWAGLTLIKLFLSLLKFWKKKKLQQICPKIWEKIVKNEHSTIK
jgi:hypothetical protein